MENIVKFIIQIAEGQIIQESANMEDKDIDYMVQREDVENLIDMIENSRWELKVGEYEAKATHEDPPEYECWIESVKRLDDLKEIKEVA